MGEVEAVNGNIKSLLRRGRGNTIDFTLSPKRDLTAA
jgi:hypothetical protein